MTSNIDVEAVVNCPQSSLRSPAYFEDCSNRTHSLLRILAGNSTDTPEESDDDVAFQHHIVVITVTLKAFRTVAHTLNPFSE